MSTVLPSLIMPAIAPATDAGLDLDDTFRKPISGCSDDIGDCMYALISSSFDLCLLQLFILCVLLERSNETRVNHQKQAGCER